MKYYTNAFLFNDRRVILLEKLQPEWQAGLLNGVGGKMNLGELPVDCAQREISEEIGLSGVALKRFCSYGGDGWMMYCFVGKFTNAQRRLLPVYNDVGERIVLTHFSKVLSDPRGYISNLVWLLPMAWNAIRRPNIVYQVHEFVQP